MKLQEIRILDRYEQLNNAIIGKFDSIDALEAELGYSNGTLSRYLRDPELLSPGKHDKLKSKIFRYLGQSLSEILLDDDDQIRNYIDNISENIDEYYSEEDIYIFEKLESLCLQQNVGIYLAHLYKSWGRYCYNMKSPLIANRYYWKAVDLYKAAYSNDDIMKCYNDIGYVCTYSGNYEEAKRVFWEADNIIKRSSGVSNETTFFHYFRWGVLLNREQIGEHAYAREKFNNALNYAPDKRNLGSTYMNIGLSYKKQRQFTQARKFYKTALEVFEDEHNALKGKVYNNFAELEKCADNYQKALFYIKKAFDMINGTCNQEYIVFFQTYVQIKAHLGEHRDTLKDLLSMIKDYKNHNVYKYFEVAAIRTILEFGNFEPELLKELKDIVYNLIVSAEDECSSYTKELMQCLGEIDFAVWKLSYGIN